MDVATSSTEIQKGSKSFAQRASRRLREELARRLKTPTGLRMLNNYLYDALRFTGASTALRQSKDQEALSSQLVFQYHKLEKGLALPTPKPGFGGVVVKRIDGLVRQYIGLYGVDETVSDTLGALRTFVAESQKGGHEFPLANKLIAEYGHGGRGGVIAVTREAIHAHRLNDPEAFFANRYSIRNFAPEPVDRSLLERAVRMAQKTPSVCNRQCGRVHVFTTPDLKRQALSFQNGNRGFGHLASAVIVVTADMRGFLSVGERNQAWVDGGLFAMSVNYALHALGLGACMLNWSVEDKVDRAMRKAMRIPDHEAVITMMAVGNIPEQLRVAQSPRKPLEQVARFDGQ